MEKDVIIACDFKNKEQMEQFLLNFANEKLFLKIGMELFYATGIEYIKYLKKQGYKIFLDLKLHDIPTTVFKTIKVLANLDVDIINVHASGGSVMMVAAKDAIGEKKTKIIAVTQLTSTSQKMLNEELLIDKTIMQTVKRYANNAKNSGLDGVVCSAQEALEIKKIDRNFMIVTPGIRLNDDENNDQIRVTTPKEAKELGATHIVVGRSITKANNPYEIYLKIKKEFLEE